MDENAIEKLLVADWASGLRLTTVPQAMRRRSLTDELDFRSRAAVRLYGLWQSSLGTPEKVQEIASAIGLKESSDLEALSQGWAGQIGTWGLAPILLTDNEKLMARHMRAIRLQGQALPDSENIAAALDIPP